MLSRFSAFCRWRHPAYVSEAESENTPDQEGNVGSSNLTPSDTLSVNSNFSDAETGSIDASDDEWVPPFGYHHVLMIIGAISIAGLVLSLAGCSTPGFIQNFHLLSISYRPESAPIDTRSPLMLNHTLPDILHQWTLDSMNEPMRVEAVQVGYFSSCVKLHLEQWQCGIRKPDVQLIDPLGVVGAAYSFRTHVTSSILVILGVVFTSLSIVVLSLFPGWNTVDGGSEDYKPYPSSQYANLIALVNGFAGIVLYIGIAWQQIAITSAATAIEGLRYGSVEVQMGVMAAVFGWLGVFLSFLCALGGILMGVSLHLLDELASE